MKKTNTQEKKLMSILFVNILNNNHLAKNAQLFIYVNQLSDIHVKEQSMWKCNVLYMTLIEQKNDVFVKNVWKNRMYMYFVTRGLTIKKNIKKK